MNDLILREAEKIETHRHQILVVQVPMFMKADEVSQLRENLKKQMADGLVIVSGSITAFTVDADEIIITGG